MRFPLLLLSPLLFLLPANAADWPQWRGPDRTGYVPAGEPVPSQLPSEPKIVWHITIGDGFSSPVISGGKVFYSDNQEGYETLHALDASTGTELWRTNIDKVFKDNQTVPGPRCTPTVDGDRLYDQSCRGELHCVSVSDGALLWRVNFNNDFGAMFIGERGTAQGATRHGNNGSPVVNGNYLLAQVGSTNGAGIVAFDKKTGKTAWKSQNDEAGYAGPMVAEVDGVKQFVSFTTLGLIGLALDDGHLLWRVPLKTTFSRHVTTPIIVGDMVVVSSHEFGLTGIKVSHDGATWKAEQKWLKKESAVNFACPVAVGNYVYGLGPEKNLICVDIQTGERKWSKTGYINSSADRSYAGFIVMGGNILVLTDSGQLVLFAADPKEFREISTAQVCGKNWCNPAYANGKLVLRDARELVCVDLMH